MVDDNVTAATCAELRRAAARGESLDALAKSYRFEYRVIHRHVWGRCGHSIDEPAMPIE